MPLSELPLGLGSWVLLVLAGGVFGADSVSFPQVMISRPIVAATFGGAVLGSAESGFLVGAVLEILTMRHAPLGAARYPDMGPAGIVAGGSFAAAGGAGLGTFAFAVVAGWAVGWIGAVAVYARRRLNERVVWPEQELAARPSLLERRHRLAIWLDVTRGSLLVAAFLVPVAVGAGLTAGGSLAPSLSTFGTWALLLGLASLAGASARITAFGLRGWPLLLVGAAVAVGVLVLTV